MSAPTSPLRPGHRRRRRRLRRWIGFADYSVTDGKARVRATVHSTLMIVALVLYLVSLAPARRLTGRPEPSPSPCRSWRSTSS